MAPIMTCVFFATLSVLEGRPQLAVATALQKLRPALLANYALWPLCHVINFALVPPQASLS